MAEAAETKAEREARWWADWFASNYSWEGLASREIRGGGQYGEATLQAYWRRDPKTGDVRTDEALKALDELVEFDGRWWHIVHLPLCEAGRERTSWKTNPASPDWARVTTLVTDRLASAQHTAGVRMTGLWIPKGRDCRARLDGGVLGPALNRPYSEADPFHLSCVQAWFADVACSWSGQELGPGTDFDNAFLSGHARFPGVTFSGDSNFDRVTFSGDASFDRAVFSGDATFHGAAFVGDAHFYSAVFSADAKFHRATFSGDARFADTIFSCEAHFSATFSGSAHFRGAIFSGTAAFGAIFSGYVIFDGATFSGEARFGQATFSRTVSFHSTTFSGAAGFESATFFGPADFYISTFSGDAHFDRAIFSDNTQFYRAAFSGGAFFDGATFEKLVTFSSPDDRVGFDRGARASFRSAVFRGRVEFSSTIAEPERSFAGAFHAAQFLHIADFSGAVAPGQAGRLAAAFEETQFEKALILTDGSDRPARNYFHRFVLPYALGESNDGRDIRLRKLEAGCRTIKIAMGKARDELREQRYYRFQLQARLGRSDIDGWERAFGLAYQLLSDFGSSLWRPLLALVLFTALCGQGYAVWGASLVGGRFAPVPSRDFVFEGQGLALAALKPFATIEAPKSRDKPIKDSAAENKVPPPWVRATVVGVLTDNAAVALGLRVATALQVVGSTLLVFLFGLAVKRRFQIS